MDTDMPACWNPAALYTVESDILCGTTPPAGARLATGAALGGGNALSLSYAAQLARHRLEMICWCAACSGEVDPEPGNRMG